MKIALTKPLRNFEHGKLDRRQLIQGLGLTAASFFAGSASLRAAAAGKVTPTTTVHHLALTVTDYARSRDWYIDLFGGRDVWDDGKGANVEFGSVTEPNSLNIHKVSRPTDAPGIGHFAFGSSNFMAEKDAMKAAMEHWGLQGIKADSERGWIANDPAGYGLNPWCSLHDKALYPGSAGPCAVADSEKCKAGWEVGVKNLDSIPKPGGKGFRAIAFSHIVLHVPEAWLQKERAFYSGMFGMKVLSSTASGPDAGSVLRFGQNTLEIRKTAHPDDKPYCNEFGFLIENYDHAKVKAELERRGLKPTLDSKRGWIVEDPDGLRISIAGKAA